MGRFSPRTGARKSAVQLRLHWQWVHLGSRPCQSFFPSPQLVNVMPHVTSSPANYTLTPCSSAHNSTITMGTQNQDKIHSTSAIYIGEHIKPNAHQECMSTFMRTSTESAVWLTTFILTHVVIVCYYKIYKLVQVCTVASSPGLGMRLVCTADFLPGENLGMLHLTIRWAAHAWFP